MKRNKRISFIIIFIMLIHVTLPVVNASYNNITNTKSENNTTTDATMNDTEAETNTTIEKPEEEKKPEIQDNTSQDTSVTDKNQESSDEKKEKDENDIDDKDSEDSKDNSQEDSIMTDAIEENGIMPLSAGNTQELANGTYTIRTALNSKKVLDIAGGSTANGANVQIWSEANVNQQKFNVTYLGNGYYTIQSVHAKKVLDVVGAGKNNGTNVQQYTSNNSDAQKWIIKKDKTGYYSIISKCNGLYLDVAGAATKDGTNVQMYKGNGTKSQLFVFEKIEQPTQTIANGTYTIRTALNTNKVLDIEGGSTNNNANVQIYKDNFTNAQKFNVTYLGNGYYTIQSVHAKKVLDVVGAGTANGTNVQQYTSNHSDAQQWIIKKDKTGYYSIISKCNGLYLDVAGASTSNGANIQMYKGNGTKSQLFVFEKTEELKQTIKDGMYKIKSAKDTSKVLDISGGAKNNYANVQIWSDANVNQQKFHVTYLGNGYYSIRAVHSKSSLDVAGAGTVNGTNVQQYEYNGSTAQKWAIKDWGNGKYSIISKCNGLYLDINGGTMTDGANVQMYKPNGSDAQKFIFEATSSQAIENGTYEIQTALNTSKVLDVSGGSKANGANVQIWGQADVNQQKFQITHLGNNYYTIEAVHSNKVLDVAGAGKTNGTNVQQYTGNKSTAQKWMIKDLGDGYYNIISQCNNLYLDIAGGSTKDGTNVQMYQANGTTSQKFKFQKTIPIGTSNFSTLDDSKYPGYKTLLQQIQNQHPNWIINVHYTGLDWNTVIQQENQIISGSPRSLVYDTYKNEWINGTTKYDVTQRWYRASEKAIAYMMDPRNSLTDKWIFQFQDLSSSSGTKTEISKMVSGTFLNKDSIINTIIETAQEKGISPFHLVSRILQEQGSDGKGTMNGNYTYLRKKDI